MKRILNLFYTFSFKFFLLILVIVLSWSAGSKVLKVLNFYIEDPISARNVFRQWDGFDYESSAFLENEIETTVENVMLICLKYGGAQNETNEMLDYYRRQGDENYREATVYLESLDGVYYAVVNHESDKIISNIEAINNKSSGTPIRSFFGSNDKTSLIVRNVKNPTYETGTMIDYIEFVSECAANYSEDFDLYITFGDDLVFRHEVSYYESLHNEMKEKALVEINTVHLLTIGCIIVMLIIFLLSGKVEPGGKVIATALDKLPNDLHLLLDFIIYTSISALYKNSIYMLFRSAFSEGDYWLGISPEFYAFRANICIVVITCVILGTACTIKRQKKMKTLVSNTYIYRFIKSHLPQNDK